MEFNLKSAESPIPPPIVKYEVLSPRGNKAPGIMEIDRLPISSPETKTTDKIKIIKNMFFLSYTFLL